MSHVLPRTETRVATASPALAPPPGHPRFPLVDSLRGAALVGVIVLHASGATNALDAPGWGRSVYALSVGLTLFFVLSGFLLYRPFVAGRSGVLPLSRPAITDAAAPPGSSRRTGSPSRRWRCGRA